MRQMQVHFRGHVINWRSDCIISLVDSFFRHMKSWRLIWGLAKYPVTIHSLSFFVPVMLCVWEGLISFMGSLVKRDFSFLGKLISFLFFFSSLLFPFQPKIHSFLTFSLSVCLRCFLLPSFPLQYWISETEGTFKIP